MALDRDGAVSGLYGVVVGPTLFFAYPGGVLMSKTLGELDEAELTRKVGALVEARAGASEHSSAVRSASRCWRRCRSRAAGSSPPCGRSSGGWACGTRWSRAQPGRSPRELKNRLRHLSDRVHGEHVVNLRREPIASAYRVFFRQIGIDPDEHKPPGEAVMLERLRAGRFKSHDLLEDALTVAVVETGVAVRAFDADRIEGELGLRIAQPGEHLAGRPARPPRGRDRGGRRAAAGRAGVRGDRQRGLGRARRRGGSRCAWCGSRASRTSASRRRSGPPQAF